MSDEAVKISKSMLIIKSDPNSLKGVEQFLKNREWFLGSTHQMKDAILFLVKNKPSFVLITVDHPSPKMRKLPKIISSAFPACVMVYAEKATTASFKLLMDSGVEYKINPPVTGPAVERAVNKYIRDQEQASRQKGEAISSDPNKSSFDFQVEVKSGESGNHGSNIAYQGGPGSAAGGGAGSISGGDAGGADSLAMRLLAQLNDDHDTSHAPGSLGGSGGGASGTHGENKSPHGGVINFQSKTADANPDLTPEARAALEMGTKKRKQFDAQGNEINLDPGSAQAQELSLNQGKTGNGQELGVEAGKKTAGELAVNAKKDKEEAEDVLIGTARKRKGNSNDPEMPNPEQGADLYVPTQELKNKNPLGEQTKATGKQDIIIGKEIDNPDLKKKKSEPDSLRIKSDGYFEKESVFVKGVNQALDDTVVKGNGEVLENLEDNSHLACITVESAKFSGYLVAALGKDKRIDNQFVDLIKVKLLKFLRDNGEPIENDTSLQLKVKRVDFEGWALEYAQFLRKSVHKGDEVAMAFFPYADAQTKVGESAEASMVSVKTDEIQTETPLEFNMYIYLPSNKKYILYTPEGGKFLKEQKARLMRQGVSKMHIQKGDVQNLGKFKAQNHLNSLIKEFETKDKTAKKKKAA